MAGVFLIPDGPKNISNMTPNVDWSRVADYYVEALSGGSVVASTPLIIPVRCGQDEGISIHFLNYLGAFDSVVFPKPKITHEVTSSEYIKGLSNPTSMQDSGIERQNVKSNDTYEAKLTCTEEMMTWLQECIDSPKAFIEMDVFEGQGDDFQPIRIIDAKFEKQKNENEFYYFFTLLFKLSNEFTIIRN